MKFILTSLPIVVVSLLVCFLAGCKSDLEKEEPVLIEDALDQAEMWSDTEIRTWIVEARKHDLDPEKVRSVLEQTGWIPNIDETSLYFMQELDAMAFAVRDIDGDSQSEWIISLVNSSDRFCRHGLPCPGSLIIVNQNGLNIDLSNESGFLWSYPLAIIDHDLTGDGLPEIITQTSTVGANGVYLLFHVFQFQNGKIKSLVNQTSAIPEIPSGCQVNLLVKKDWNFEGIPFSNGGLRLEDMNGDGLHDLILSGSGTDEAGNYCRKTELWSWDHESSSLLQDHAFEE